MRASSMIFQLFLLLQVLANSTKECSGQVMPRYQVDCHVPCPQDCILSPWSAWSRCPPAQCSSSRSHHHSRLPLRQRNRTILAIAGPGGQSCPDQDSLMEMSACPDTFLTGCEWYSWRHGGWDTCQLAPGYQCGKGLQTRRVYCQDAGGQVVPDWRCSRLRSVSKRRSCEVTCPRNCEVSQWTDWSQCPDLCQSGSSEGGHLLMEIQRRERVILVSASDGGTSCPDTTQVRPCPLLAGSCRQPAWDLGQWSKCTLPTGLTCGQGLRSRSVSCSRAGVVSLPLTNCLDTAGAVPDQSQVCHVDCSEQECVMGAWSAWSHCPHQHCGHTRSRHRSPVSSDHCSHSQLSTQQEEQCPCDQYSARPVGAWSQCIVTSSTRASAGHARHVVSSNVAHSPECGEGERYRRLHCYDTAGNIVDAELCGGDQYLTEQCYVSCPADCSLSAWSDWGLCDTVCGPGLRNRTSRVTQLPNRYGRPCPGPTVEYDTCDYTCDSFTWHTSAWSQCNIGQGNCGSGTRRRTVRWVIDEREIPALLDQITYRYNINIGVATHKICICLL